MVLIPPPQVSSFAMKSAEIGFLSHSVPTFMLNSGSLEPFCPLSEKTRFSLCLLLEGRRAVSRTGQALAEQSEKRIHS